MGIKQIKKSIRKRINRENIIIILSLAIFSLLITYSFLSNRYCICDDSTFHMNRIIGISNAFEEKQILPKIYPYANNGFGYATPLFYCDIFLYPFAILYHFGLSLVICYKIAIIFYVFIGNVIVFYILEKVTKNRIVSILGLLLYSLNNYRLQDVLLRSAFGEILAICFIPLVAYSIYKILILKEDAWILLGVSYSLLVMSHLISTFLVSLVFTILLVVYIIFNRKNLLQIKNVIKTVFKGTILAILLTAWYIIPMMEQMLDQTFWLTPNASHNDLSITTQNAKVLFQLFACVDHEKMNIDKESAAGLVLVASSCIYIFVNKNKYINVLIAITVFLYLTLFGILPYAYLNIVQFLFRLYLLIVPMLIIIAVYSISNIKRDSIRKLLLVIIAIIGVINIYFINREMLSDGHRFIYNNTSPSEIYNTKETSKETYNHEEIGGAEYLPHPTGYINFNKETPAIKYIDKNNNKIDSIWDYDRWFTRVEFSCNYDEDKTLIIPLSYYKGYKGYELIGDIYKEIDLYDYEEYKELAIDAPAGQHTYMIRYEGTIVQKVTLVLSVLTFIGLIVYVIKKKNKTNV